MRPEDDGHEWLSIRDDEGTDWLFDVTFLLSSFRCIYGEGCQSIAPVSSPSLQSSTNMLGCCTHGAHLLDDEDLAAVQQAAAQLTAQDWQFKALAERVGGPLKKTRSGSWATRKVKGACVFLNRDGFSGGPGCALHQAALRNEARPMDWKPDVCWQVPIRLNVHEDDYGHQTVFIRAWKRSDWGPGGEDLGWWCIEDHEPYRGSEPLYQSSSAELTELLGKSLYDRLAIELARRNKETPVYLQRS